MKLASLLFVSLCYYVPVFQCRDVKVSPEKSIQSALDEAQPGDTIILSDGYYAQDFRSVRDGTPDQRITISGTRKAVVTGESASRMIEISHSYHTLEGFSVSGKKNDGKQAEDYVDKCVFVLGSKQPEVVREGGVEYESSLDGLIVRNLFISDCGGECLRLRSFVTNAEVVGNKIQGCGRHDFLFPSSSVNGEAIYVGTSSNQWDDGKNSREGPDLSKFIWIHDNEIDSQGNECVDVKEGTTDVLVEYNICSDQRDPNSAGLDSRTDDVVFRYNEVVDCEGAGVRIGGHTIDGRTYGKNNEVYGNVFSNTRFSSVKVETGVDHTMCENQCGDDCSMRGSEAKQFSNIEDSCKSKSVRDIAWIGKSNTHRDLRPVILDEVTMVVDSKSKDDESNSLCEPAKITASSSSDGKELENAVDGKAVTRWSANGKGSWLSVNFDKKVEVSSLKMSFYKGDSRQQFFEVYGDGEPLLKKGMSSGRTVGLQSFAFDTPKSLGHLTIFGNGNSEDDWNSMSEIMFCMGQVREENSEKENPKEENPEEECDTFELLVEGVRSSSDDGNKAENVLGKDLKTRWSCKPKDSESPCDITLTLKEPSYVAEIEFAIFEGKSRVQRYDLQLMTELEQWEEVVVDGRSEKIRGVQSIDVDVDGVKEVKFIGYGNDQDDYTSLVFLGVIGC